MVNNSGSTSRSIISSLSPGFFCANKPYIDQILPLKVRGSGNYDTPCIINYGASLPRASAIRPHRTGAEGAALAAR